jgi:hypothetical protein
MKTINKKKRETNTQVAIGAGVLVLLLLVWLTVADLLGDTDVSMVMFQSM